MCQIFSFLKPFALLFVPCHPLPEERMEIHNAMVYNSDTKCVCFANLKQCGFHWEEGGEGEWNRADNFKIKSSLVYTFLHNWQQKSYRNYHSIGQMQQDSKECKKSLLLDQRNVYLIKQPSPTMSNRRTRNLYCSTIALKHSQWIKLQDFFKDGNSFKCLIKYFIYFLKINILFIRPDCTSESNLGVVLPC